MTNYSAQGNKTIYCKCGHTHTIPFQQTSYTCPDCKCKLFVNFFGVIVDKYGNYRY